MKRSEIEARVKLIGSNGPDTKQGADALIELVTEFLFNVQIIADHVRREPEKGLAPRAPE